MNWKDRITAEKSLFQVYIKARRVATARSNTRVAWSVFSILGIVFAVNAYSDYPIASYGSIIATIRRIAETGFSLTTSILGFLIAGFAIFASITKPEVFVMLAKLDHKKGGISRLQFIFFNFLIVFVHYLAFLSVCIMVKLLLYSGGPLAGGIRIIHEYSKDIIEYSSVAVLASGAGWLAFLLMLLKSFIWNMYQAVLVTIVTGDEVQRIENDSRRQSGAGD